MLRLAKDTRQISVKQYLMSVELLNEIGRMLTAWIEVAIGITLPTLGHSQRI